MQGKIQAQIKYNRIFWGKSRLKLNTTGYSGEIQAQIKYNRVFRVKPKLKLNTTGYSGENPSSN